MSNVCEERVFKSVYDTHSTYLRNFLYYKSGDLELSKDLMQDAFQKLWENCSKVILSKAKSYLFTIANNMFLNQVKRQSVRLQFKKANANEDLAEDPQYLLEEQEFKLKLENAISNLPEKQRIVFLMNRIDKKKYREIAEELNISIKAVEKRMHQALKVLKEVHKGI